MTVAAQSPIHEPEAHAETAATEAPPKATVGDRHPSPGDTSSDISRQGGHRSELSERQEHRSSTTTHLTSGVTIGVVRSDRREPHCAAGTAKQLALPIRVLPGDQQ